MTTENVPPTMDTMRKLTEAEKRAVEEAERAIEAAQRTIKPKTFIRETLDGGYQAGFTIGNQTFFLQENELDVVDDPKQAAEWYAKQLQHALDKLFRTTLTAGGVIPDNTRDEN